MHQLIMLSMICISLMSFNLEATIQHDHLMQCEEKHEARFKKKRSKKGHTTVEYKNDQYVVINNSADIGLGALVFSIFSVLDDFEQGKAAGLFVNFNSGCYLDPDFGPNWWEYFFEPIALGDDKAPPFYLDQKQVLLAIHKGYLISRFRSAELAKKYIIFKPHIQQEIDSYIEQYFQGHYVIGVHHRGTDKKTEVPLVPFERTLAILSDSIAKLTPSERNNLRIYVATDEQAFLDKITQLYPSHVIHNDFVRSKDGLPLHYSQDLYGSNYQKGKETVLDCFLLSKCHLLIYPASSSYSYLATALNDHLQAIPVTCWK